MVDVAQDVVITDEDCGTTAGLFTTAIIEGGDIVEALADRVLGRTVAQDVYAADGKTLLVERGTLIDEAWVDKLEELGVDEMVVRSAITCENNTRCLPGVLRTRSSPRTSRECW